MSLSSDFIPTQTVDRQQPNKAFVRIAIATVISGSVSVCLLFLMSLCSFYITFDYLFGSLTTDATVDEASAVPKQTDVNE